MTTEELENLGIIDESSQIFPRRYFIPRIGQVKIPEHYSKYDVFDLIYERAFDEGVERGKELKSNEILEVLGINKDRL